jgi:hypothetical protein
LLVESTWSLLLLLLLSHGMRRGRQVGRLRLNWGLARSRHCRRCLNILRIAKPLLQLNRCRQVYLAQQNDMPALQAGQRILCGFDDVSRLDLSCFKEWSHSAQCHA